MSRYTKARAIVLAAVMVFSIVGGTVALAGTGAAVAGSINADSNYIQTGDSASFTVSDGDDPNSAEVGFTSGTEAAASTSDDFTQDTSTTVTQQVVVNNAPIADTNDDGAIDGDDITVSATSADVSFVSADPVSGTVEYSIETAGGEDDTVTVSYDYYPESVSVDATSGSATASIPTDGSTPSGDNTLQVSDGDTVTAYYWDADQSVYQTATLSVDDSAPTASITNPSDEDVVQSQDTIEGTASDENGVSGVELIIQRSSDNTYYTGSGWQETETTVSASADSGSFDSPDESWSYDSSAITGEDTYIVTATATDDAGNTADSSPVSYTIDTTSPSISGVSLSNDGSNNVDFSFDSDEQLGGSDGDISVTVDGPSTDGVYTFSGDEFSESSDAESGYTYTLDTDQAYEDGDGQYTASVDDALDAAGNNGGNNGDGSELTDSYTLDSTGPTIANPSPGDGTATADDQQVYTVDITDDDAGVDESTITVTVEDGDGNTHIDSAGTDNPAVSYNENSLEVDPSGEFTYADGTVDVTVNADDNDGNSASEFSSSFDVDTTAPTIDSPSPEDGGLTADDQVTYTVEISDEGTGVDADTITVTVDGSDTTHLDAVGTGDDAVSLDGTTLTVDPTGGDGEGFTYTDGQITVTVNADDDVGNSASEFSSSFDVDTESPSIYGKDLSNDGEDNIAFSFDAGESLGSDAADIKVDVEGPNGATYPFDRNDFTENANDGGDYTYTLTAEQAYNDGDGQYTATVLDAFDPAGNNGGVNGDGEDLTDTYTLDANKPSAEFDSDSLLVSGTYDLTQDTTVTNDESPTYEYSTDDGNSWTEITDASTWDTTNVDDGDVVVRVTATDAQENSDSDTATATVDNTQPTVEAIDVTQTPINDSTRGNKQLVTVTFSEAMDTSQIPQIDYDQDGDGTPEAANIATAKDGVGNNGFGVDDGYDEEAKTWVGTISADTFSNGVNGTANLVVSNAQDPSDNAVDAEANTDQIYVDTTAPSISVNTGNVPGAARDNIDVTQYFDISANDNDELQKQYAVINESGPVVLDSPTAFDTTTQDEGNVQFGAYTVDDVGNDAGPESTADVQIDNKDPSASAKIEDGQTMAGDIAVSDVFDIEKGDEETVTFEVDTDDDGDYEVTQIDGENDPSAFTSWDSSAVSDGDSVAFRVTVGDDPDASDVTKEVGAVIDNADGLGVMTDTQGDGSIALGLTPEAGAQAKSTLVFVNQSDDTGSASIALTLDDFNEVQDRFGDYHYVTTFGDELPDGSYDVRVVKFTDEHDRVQQNIDADGSTGDTTNGVDDDVQVDQSAPSIENAYVTDAASDEMTVRVVFDEAVSGTTKADFADVNGASVSNVDTGVGDSDEVALTLDDNVQTGGAPDVSVNDNGGITEVYDNSGTPASVAAGDSTELHTLRTTLQPGLNAFSVPAVSGALNADRLADNDNFESIWYYNASQGEWINYIPGQDDELYLYGGQGYFVEMSGHATYDLNVNNHVTSVPTEQNLEKGWNFIGHYQESSQTADGSVNAAFESISGSYETNQVYKQSEVAPPEFAVLTHGDDSLEPGEAYWIRVNDAGEVYTHEPLAAAS